MATKGTMPSVFAGDPTKKPTLQRRAITAAVVAGIDRLLAERRRHTTIAKRLGVSKYLVQVVAHDKDRIGRPAPKQDEGFRYPNRPNATDAATVRMIQRMLEVGILRHPEIAREVGVSRNFVSEVAVGKRVPLDTSRPPLVSDERFLPESIRCSVCRRRISIVPCRACKAVRESHPKKSTWCM